MAEGKALLTPSHSLNAFSEPRSSMALELVEASKSGLPILLVVVYAKWNLAYTTKQVQLMSHTPLPKAAKPVWVK